VSDWERGKYSPERENLQNLAKALETSVAYLIGETNNPEGHYLKGEMGNTTVLSSALRGGEEAREPGKVRGETSDAPPRLPPNLLPFFPSGQGTAAAGPDAAPGKTGKDCECPADCGLIKIPVVAINPDFDLGEGVPFDDVGLAVEGWECVNRRELGPVEEKRPPFIVRMESDSMDRAGIRSGDKIIVNHAVEVKDGNAALVCYGPNREYAVKWVYWENDGGVTIRSANRRYQPRTFSREDIENNLFSVVGKVVQVVGKPLDG
jgi:hypothetical protein